MVKAGNFKLLAVASPKRFGQILDTPAISEKIPDFVTGSFQGRIDQTAFWGKVIQENSIKLQ